MVEGEGLGTIARRIIDSSFSTKLAEAAGFDRIGVAGHAWQHPIMGGPKRTNQGATRSSRSSQHTRRVDLTAMV